MATKKKPSVRQRVEIKKIENEPKLHVTFSKRRAGLFKKASELSTLCGAEVGLIAFSPANRVYTFGHKDIESVVNRYLSGVPESKTQMERLFEARRNANLDEINQRLMFAERQLNAEKERGRCLDQILQADEAQYGCNNFSLSDDLTLEQLEELKAKMEDLQTNVEAYKYLA